MFDEVRWFLRGLLGSTLCVVLLLGCATVDDPRKADIFTFSQTKSQKFLDEQQAELDALQQRRVQLELEKEKLRHDNEAKEKERDVLVAQLSELNREVDSLDARLAYSKTSSSKLQARRKELQTQIKALKRELSECQTQVQVQETPESAALQKRLDALRRKQRQLEQEYSILSGNPS